VIIGEHICSSTKSIANNKSCLKGIGEVGKWGETIHNLGVNHRIKNGFGIMIKIRAKGNYRSLINDHHHYYR
jgi:hypothetical protein